MTLPHTYNEFENMLRTFSCQDLANLLEFAGKPKNGQKMNYTIDV